MSSKPIIGWVAMKVVDKFVCHTREDEKFNNTLKASGDKALTPYTRFYLEQSAKKNELVHIRSCYNNMYWVPKKVDDSWYIFVDAKEPEENLAKSSCTLFKLFSKPTDSESKSKSDDKPSVFQITPCYFEHVKVTTNKSGEKDQSKYHPRRLCQTNEGRLFVADENQGLEFGIITLDEEKALPTYVRFKGDNDKYIGPHHEYDTLSFTWEDGNKTGAVHIVETSPDGSYINIRSQKTGNLWKCDSDGWILSNFDYKDNESSRFEVVGLGGNVIALKNIGNGKFAKRSPEDGLIAATDSIEVCAQLKVEEAVVTRKIYDVQYHMDAIRVYDQKNLVMATASSVNYSSTETTAKLTLKYGVANTSSWNKTTTETWGVSTSFHAGLPAIDIGKEGFSFGITPELGFSKENNSEHTFTEEYGGTQTRTEEKSVDYDMKVPPRTKMTLRAITSQMSCDIPYSYLQKDVLTDGRRIVTKGEDGLFQGVLCHEFTYEVIEEKVPDDDKKAQNSNNLSEGTA